MKILLISVFLLCVATCVQAQYGSNLLTNPGAETGDFSGWIRTDGGSGWVPSLVQSTNLEPASQMVSRSLKFPSLNVNDPNISADGNWVVCVAWDAKLISNVFIINASGGDPKNITNDTVNRNNVTPWVSPLSTPCFSPNGTEIVFVRWDNETNSSNIYKISVLGGTPHKIISNGVLPIWSPDGKHIGFYRFSKGTTLLIANPDGTDELELTRIDSAFAINLGWSPDSKEIAFLRSYKSQAADRYSEIFLRNLASGTERQVTNDKHLIDDFCWTTSDEFVFNSNRGGNTNLWTIPATGGTPEQLTLGAGNDRVPRVSKDAKRLVYVNECPSNNLWIADVETKEKSQLSFDDASLTEPVYSPDGERIAYKRATESTQSVFICNKNGSNPVRLMSVTSPCCLGGLLCWSGDGKSIAYTIDTLKGMAWCGAQIIVHNLSTNIPRKMGNGIIYDWSPDGKYILYQSVESNDKYFLAAVESTDYPRKLIPTRSWPSFSRDSRSVIYEDSSGVWSMPIEKGAATLLFSAKKNEISFPRETKDGKCLTFQKWTGQKAVYGLFLVSKSGTQSKELVELSLNGGLVSSISPDLRSVVFNKSEPANKIMLIDNFR